MKDFAERLGKTREAAFGRTGRSAFARALGIPLTSYLNFEHGRVPPMDIIVKMMTLTRVNPRWLVHGEGPQYLPRDVELPPAEDAASLVAALLEQNAKLEEQLLAAKRSAHPAVLVVPADVAPKEWLAGHGQIQAASEEYVAVPILSGKNAENPPENVFEADRDGWALCPRSAVRHPKSTFATRVEDDAMAPAIPQGSLVGVDCSIRDPRKLCKDAGAAVAVRDPRLGCTVRRIEKADQHWLFLPASRSEENKAVVWSEGGGTECPAIGAVIFAFVAYSSGGSATGATRHRMTRTL